MKNLPTLRFSQSDLTLPKEEGWSEFFCWERFTYVAVIIKYESKK